MSEEGELWRIFEISSVDGVLFVVDIGEGFGRGGVFFWGINEKSYFRIGGYRDLKKNGLK